MNATPWMEIPKRLEGAGFTVFYERISYDAENPLWRAKANRRGKEWGSMGKTLSEALLELEKQTQEPRLDWHDILATEKSKLLPARHHQPG